MKPLKPFPIKRSDKKEREKQVLFGLVEYYIKHGKAIGSNTLREHGFEELSSATIRNYFMKLEKSGYLSQEHSSAGRIPTNAAYRLYAKEFLDSGTVDESTEARLRELKAGEGKEIAHFLQKSAELLGSLTHLAVFLSTPRFDHDFISEVKLVSIDNRRCLCVIVTDFGLVKTEILHTESKLSSFNLRHIEAYFHWRLRDQDPPENLSDFELAMAQKFYNEIMVRYVVGYSNFIDEDLYWTGFSHLLSYPEFHDTPQLASALALFENPQSMRHLLRECTTHNRLKFWIGRDLKHNVGKAKNCAILTIPYYINQRPVGAVGLLGPNRLPYRQLFGTLHVFSQYLSEALTRDVYKLKITFRQPEPASPYLEETQNALIDQAKPLLLEDKSLS